MSMRSRIVVAAVVLGSLLEPRSAQRGNSLPSVSVRPPDFIYKVTAGAALPSLGWKIGVPIGVIQSSDSDEQIRPHDSPHLTERIFFARSPF